MSISLQRFKGAVQNSNWKQSKICNSKTPEDHLLSLVLSALKSSWVEWAGRTNISRSPKNLSKKDKMRSFMTKQAEANFKGQEVAQP